jgi:hypothetical protein
MTGTIQRIGSRMDHLDADVFRSTKRATAPAQCRRRSEPSIDRESGLGTRGRKGRKVNLRVSGDV